MHQAKKISRKTILNRFAVAPTESLLHPTIKKTPVEVFFYEEYSVQNVFTNSEQIVLTTPLQKFLKTIIR